MPRYKYDIVNDNEVVDTFFTLKEAKENCKAGETIFRSEI
jgi:hypothetical protein